MAKVRAYGADATLKVCRETSYGVAPTSGYRSLDFKSTDLSSEQPLGDDPLLGRGRNAQDPYRGLITDEGKIEIPLDLRASGFWLTGLFGDPATTQTKAAGRIAFSGQPAANSTITLNGVAWTFVTGMPVGSQTQIGVSLDATLTALAADLNASVDAQISKCTYTANTADDRLEIELDTAGTSGNTFTLAASANSGGTVSAATLTGGGYQHEWLSGGDDIPSFTFEIGHPKLITPVFFRHLGTVLESLAFEMGQEGPANGTVQLVAQGEETAAATIDATPDMFALKRFSQGRGFITRGGVPLAGVTGGNLNFSNNLERVRVIRDDGKIEAAEPTFASCQGAMTVRFDGTTLVAEAANGEPVSLEYGFSMAEGWKLSFELFRVFLPKPKYSVSGPGGVEASFDWRAAYDESAGTMLRARLLNDVASHG
ncbi:MAG: phage tail tube protein [Defluviicoccus sp.]|nr:phage tail tube protein [Defluviicoccus sp.]MDG4591705.1 phage tail tube protein [Defluviicoccus sp.]